MSDDERDSGHRMHESGTLSLLTIYPAVWAWRAILPSRACKAQRCSESFSKKKCSLLRMHSWICPGANRASWGLSVLKRHRKPALRKEPACWVSAFPARACMAGIEPFALSVHAGARRLLLRGLPEVEHDARWFLSPPVNRFQHPCRRLHRLHRLHRRRRYRPPCGVSFRMPCRRYRRR